VAVLGQGTAIGENFLRTAVMVALADGVYSLSEEEILQQFCLVLELDTKALTALRHTLEDTEQGQDRTIDPSDILHQMRDWLDGLEIHDPRVAKFLCKMIPSQCPFERDVTFFGRKIVHIYSAHV
jgi:hypothetical protein